MPPLILKILNRKRTTSLPEIASLAMNPKSAISGLLEPGMSG
jgi:hypothetical protein